MSQMKSTEKIFHPNFLLQKNHTNLSSTQFSQGLRTLSLSKDLLSREDKRSDKSQHHKTGKLLGLEVEYFRERLPSI